MLAIERVIESASLVFYASSITRTLLLRETSQHKAQIETPASSLHDLDHIGALSFAASSPRTHGPMRAHPRFPTAGPPAYIPALPQLRVTNQCGARRAWAERQACQEKTSGKYTAGQQRSTGEPNRFPGLDKAGSARLCRARAWMSARMPSATSLSTTSCPSSGQAQALARAA